MEQRGLTQPWRPSWSLTATSDALAISFHSCLAPANFNNRWWVLINQEHSTPVSWWCLGANMSSLKKTLVWPTALPRSQLVVTQMAPLLNLVVQAVWCSTQLRVWMKSLRTPTLAVMMKRCFKKIPKSFLNLHARWIHSSSTQGTSTGSSILSWSSASDVTSRLRTTSIRMTSWTCAAWTGRSSLTFSKH